ncbi:hypothetical protein TNCT_466791 [Trichonephila clavata]|uniref:Uncharacterized protein n=1 Tax=Trichonephila clavata TaxID=2740835 RepID=A0A8X6LM01_TRICU|nr:hypothetical protein TNCT_466791 [Trichonephila clavata]
MDQSAGEYRCYPYKLQFKHYKQFLRHKYLNHDEQELQPEINHNGESSQSSSNNFKSFCEMHIGKIPLKEQIKNNEQTDSSDVYNPLFDSNGSESIQFRHGLFIESTLAPSCLESAIGYSQEPYTRCHSNSKGYANEQSLSLKYSL